MTRTFVHLVALGALAVASVSIAQADVGIIAMPVVNRESETASQWASWSQTLCDRVIELMPEYHEAAEQIAERHIDGGRIYAPDHAQPISLELCRRAGGMMTMGALQHWPGYRPFNDRSRDSAIAGVLHVPSDDAIQALLKMHDDGVLIVGIGRADRHDLRDARAMCKVWIDTAPLLKGLPDDALDQGDLLAQTLVAWTFNGEVIAALTRRGKMPVMYKSLWVDDGKAWNENYEQKALFHDDIDVKPVEAGVVTRQCATRAKEYFKRFEETQLEWLGIAAEYMAFNRVHRGQKSIIAHTGHMPPAYIAKFSDRVWASPVPVRHNVPQEVRTFSSNLAYGQFVVRLGYFGLHDEIAAVLARKNAQTVLIAPDHPDDAFKPTRAIITMRIDPAYRFGDTSVKLPGYPIGILPPSGYMQAFAYQALHFEVMRRLPAHVMKQAAQYEQQIIDKP